jgi:hypothetical protein
MMSARRSRLARMMCRTHFEEPQSEGRAVQKNLDAQLDRQREQRCHGADGFGSEEAAVFCTGAALELRVSVSIALCRRASVTCDEPASERGTGTRRTGGGGQKGVVEDVSEAVDRMTGPSPLLGL